MYRGGDGQRLPVKEARGEDGDYVPLIEVEVQPAA